MRGELSLRIVSHRGRSFLAESYCTFPLQVLRPRPVEDGSSGMDLTVLTPCGGLLDGDELSGEVVVEDGAALWLRTQAATQVHAGSSSQRWRITVGEEARFVFLPRAIVPHAGAVHYVATQLSLAPTASSLFSEVIAPGRQHQGELFQYRELRSDVDVRCDGQLVARERQLMCPGSGLLAMQLGGYSHFGSAYVFGPYLPNADSAELELAHHIAFGESELAAGGHCVRALGSRAFDLELAFERIAARCLEASRAAPVREGTVHARISCCSAGPTRL